MSRTDFSGADSIDAFGRAVRDVLAVHALNVPCEDRIPGWHARRSVPHAPPTRLSPRLSYGRHRGPARLQARRAAVIIVVYPHRSTGQLCLTLTRRPRALSHHGGQVCLPGGRIESGESPMQAALREYHEELGVPADVITELGRLSPIYVFASDNLVDTMIVTANAPSEPWQPDPVEVDEVIEMPLASLLDVGRILKQPDKSVRSARETPGSTAFCEISSRKRTRAGKSPGTGEVFQYGFNYQAIEFIDCDGRRRELWGATAMLLEEFAAVLCRAADAEQAAED